MSSQTRSSKAATWRACCLTAVCRTAREPKARRPQLGSDQVRAGLGKKSLIITDGSSADCPSLMKRPTKGPGTYKPRRSASVVWHREDASGCLPHRTARRLDWNGASGPASRVKLHRESTPTADFGTEPAAQRSRAPSFVTASEHLKGCAGAPARSAASSLEPSFSIAGCNVINKDDPKKPGAKKSK